MRPLISALLLAAAANAPAVAQEFDLRGSGIPRDAAFRIQRILDDPSTTRLTGVATIAAGATADGAVVVSDGHLTVSGTIRGDLVALRADVVLEPGAQVDGDVTVVDGTLRGEDVARIGGTLTIYGEGFDLFARARDLHGERAWRERDDWPGDRRDGADLLVRVGWNYNRVEGLPVQFGPDIRTGGPFATRIQALAVWRTAVGPITRTETMGYEARVEQSLGGPTLRVGATMRSTVDPIEAWSLSNLEASLAAGLFHDDQRDYFERQGWSVYARVSPPRTPLDATLEYRDEEHRSIAARDPWTLFNGDHTWRAQPLVGEGDLSIIAGTVTWDDRRREGFGQRGWYARARLVRAVDGALTVPGGQDISGEPTEAATFDKGFSAGLLDVRRYDHAGSNGVLGLRLVAGGALERTALPPQFQHALGGPGTLPGHALFAADCGARRALLTRVDDPAGPTYFGGYGCDRFALAQIEYRGGFDLRFGSEWDDEGQWRDYGHFDVDFDWTVFFDAARGWAFERERLVERTGTGMLYDVGAGIILGGLGFYGALPLNRQDRGLRLFVRLGPRF